MKCQVSYQHIIKRDNIKYLQSIYKVFTKYSDTEPLLHP